MVTLPTGLFSPFTRHPSLLLLWWDGCREAGTRDPEAAGQSDAVERLYLYASID
jgi:hypothetical protein